MQDQTNFPLRKKGFISAGTSAYYEAVDPLSQNDYEVPLCPGENYFFLNGQWTECRRNGPVRNPNAPPVLIHVSSNDIHADPYQGQPQPAPAPAQPHQQATIELNQETKFQFQLKDIIVVAGFIASLAVSWTNTDQRITRLEERVTQDIAKRIDGIESKQGEMDKSHDESIKNLTFQVNDLERMVIGRGREHAPSHPEAPVYPPNQYGYPSRSGREVR